MSQFTDSVISIVRQVPYGMVASYGQIAAYTGIARAARQVGWTLNRIEGRVEVPWWRIVNNAGRISIKNTEFNTPLLMKQMLEHEGLKIAADYTFDIEKYRFRPSVELMKSWQLDDDYIERVCKKYLV
jgi:methylated-DNA-protein-cysteine methyltransferase-like protein